MSHVEAYGFEFEVKNAISGFLQSKQELKQKYKLQANFPPTNNPHCVERINDRQAEIKPLAVRLRDGASTRRVPTRDACTPTRRAEKRRRRRADANASRTARRFSADVDARAAATTTTEVASPFHCETVSSVDRFRFGGRRFVVRSFEGEGSRGEVRGDCYLDGDRCGRSR